jgi:hypothetical protein
VLAWGDNTFQACNVPALPPGLVYVGIAAGDFYGLARRSDGTVVSWGFNQYGQGNVPAPGAGLSYTKVRAAYNRASASVGPTSTFTTFGNGCAGSRPATRLVPLDTPHKGAPLQVTLFDLPANAAFLFVGLSTTTSPFGPLPLNAATFGMPGCTLYTSVDAEVFLAGAGGQATHSMVIPNVAGLVGVVFHEQALVLDPAAGNGLGAVLSDAITAVVGS